MPYRDDAVVLSERRREVRAMVAALERDRVAIEARIGALRSRLARAAPRDGRRRDRWSCSHPHPWWLVASMPVAGALAAVWLCGVVLAMLGLCNRARLTPPLRARVEVVTDTPAFVWDNGHKLGETPLDVNLDPGPHRLELAAPAASRGRRSKTCRQAVIGRFASPS
jgi:hypothetical protein